MNAKIGRLLNQRFDCPGCHASDNWSAITRTMIREASTIQGFTCRSCGEQIIAKMPHTVAGSESGKQLAHREYRMLCELQRTFPQDDQFGTLVPLGYLEVDDLGVIITRKFDGVDLIRHRSGLTRDGVRELFRPAGILLRKLHDSFPEGYRSQFLGVEDKVTYLTQTYDAELRSDRSTRAIVDQLIAGSARFSTLQLRATWSHGDFKPENVLCNDHKYLILDTRLEGRSPFVYDLASFLDHLLIVGHSIGGSDIRHWQQQAEDEFLAGYGGVNQQELAALRWAQLYFMLHYWGKYRQRSQLSKIYANWRLRPIAQKLAAQL